MDINSIRKRLNQLQTTNNRTSNLWKPQPGKQVIRDLVVQTQSKSLHKNLKRVVTEKSIRWLVNWKLR